MKKQVVLGIVFLAMFGLMFVGMVPQRAEAKVNAVALSCPNDVRIGQLVSCTATGLTVGTSTFLNKEWLQRSCRARFRKTAAGRRSTGRRCRYG